MVNTNEFRGNGAECMMHFVRDGCKGSVYRESHQFPEVNKKTWQVAASDDWSIAWLAEPCIYCPPVTMWKGISQEEAYAACLHQVHVEARRRNERDNWDTVILDDYTVWTSVDEWDFRIRED